MHEPYGSLRPSTQIRSGPFNEVPTPPNQMRWNPLPIPEQPTDFVEGIVTLGGNGDPAMQDGVGIHLYVANASMQDRFFYNADGEMLILPQQGASACAPSLAFSTSSPARSAVIPRGIKFRVDCRKARPAATSARTTGSLPPARTRPDRRQRARQLPRLSNPVAAFEDREGTFEWSPNFRASLARGIDHSPLDVVAWHGNYAPYKYDMAQFNCINTVSFDHPDPSIFTVLTSPSGCLAPRIRFRHLSSALDGRRTHLSSALVPSQHDERVHGPDSRPVRRQG